MPFSANWTPMVAIISPKRSHDDPNRTPRVRRPSGTNHIEKKEMVRRAGLEPAQEPKSSASTNSATFAGLAIITGMALRQNSSFLTPGEEDYCSWRAFPAIALLCSQRRRRSDHFREALLSLWIQVGVKDHADVADQEASFGFHADLLVAERKQSI